MAVKLACLLVWRLAGRQVHYGRRRSSAAHCPPAFARFPNCLCLCSQRFLRLQPHQPLGRPRVTSKGKGAEMLASGGQRRQVEPRDRPFTRLAIVGQPAQQQRAGAEVRRQPLRRLG